MGQQQRAQRNEGFGFEPRPCTELIPRGSAPVKADPQGLSTQEYPCWWESRVVWIAQHLCPELSGHYGSSSWCLNQSQTHSAICSSLWGSTGLHLSKWNSQSTELKRTFAFSFDWATGFLPLCLNVHQWPWECHTSPLVTSGFGALVAVCSHSVSVPRSSECWKNAKCLKQSVTNLVFSWESSTSSWDSYGRLNFSVNESTKMLIPLGC